MREMERFVGIDVSKRWLDLDIRPTGGLERLLAAEVAAWQAQRGA